jgi:transcriptional regulator with XRE-family HTH domain
MSKVRFSDKAVLKSALAFGEAVRQAREELGLTQTALGRLVGCTQENVKKIEQIGASPRSKFFLPLCEELGLNPFSFGFEGDNLAEIKMRLVDSWMEKHSENC